MSSYPPPLRSQTAAMAAKCCTPRGRWDTEAGEAFSFYVPARPPYNPATLAATPAAHVLHVPPEIAAAHGIDPALTLKYEPLKREGPPKPEAGVQTDPIVTGQ
jgi:hypothetical protein